MVKNCFVLGCKTNKWRRQWKDKRPALFCFPKSTDLLEKWIRVVPKRERDPSPTDSICSLHFKINDVLKYYEITRLTGQPKGKVERIERGCWTLDTNAVPSYFANDNPDEDDLVKDVKHRDQNGDHNYNLLTENSAVVDIDDLELHICSAPNIFMEHSYNLPLSQQPPDLCKNSTENRNLPDSSQSTTEIGRQPDPNPNSIMSENQPDPFPNSTKSDAQLDPIQKSIMFERQLHPIQLSTKSERQPEQIQYSTKSETQLCYTVCELNEDALDLVLPAKWSFIQNLEGNSTMFMLCAEDMSILRCVKFLGSCFPVITVNKQTILHRAVTSKEEIQELVKYVDNL